MPARRHHLFGDMNDFPCGSTLTIDGPAGALELLAGCPREGAGRAAVAVVCHPHPLHGGTMHNKVVHTLARSFERFGARSVRFNFRGVGASAGRFAEGHGETDDLLAVVDWVRRQRPNDELWLAGFSFGATVALRAAGRLPVSRLVTVAPAVHLYDDLAGFQAPNVPWLLVQGSADEVVEPGVVLGWVESLRRRPEVVMLDGVGHFFHQRLPELANAVAAHLVRS
jgi:alpha/beta superfamily hydrolase